MATTTLGVKLDDPTRERLKAAATSIDRTPHWLIKQAIFNYLEKLEGGATLTELSGIPGAASDDADEVQTDHAHQCFLEFAESILPQSVLRAAITSAYRRPEPEVVPMLIEQARLPAPMAEATQTLAASIAEAAAEGKPVRIAEGGKQRYDSVYAGLKAARMIATDCNVLVHDAVRPNVDKGVIDGVIDALEEYEAACPVVAVADTVLQLQDGFQPKPLNRNEIKLVQTPQGFRMEKIWFAYNEFLEQSNFEPTDDASIYLRYAFNADMAITQGNPDNFKITWPGDVGRFEQLFRRGM